MRVMHLRQTRRKKLSPTPKKGKPRRSNPKAIRSHRLFCPIGWDGFQLGDILQAADGFQWEYINYEIGKAKKTIAKIMMAKSDIPPLVFHWAFTCEECGKRDALKLGASWRPHRRQCFECEPAANWRKVEIEGESDGEDLRVEVSHG